MNHLQSFDSNTSPNHDLGFQDMHFLARQITNSFKNMDHRGGSFYFQQWPITQDLPRFSSLSSYVKADDLEPVPIGTAFTSSYHKAVQQSMLKESVDFLFGSSSSSFSQQQEDRAMSITTKKSNNKKRKRCDSDKNLSDDVSFESSESDNDRFRPYQNQQWGERFDDLKAFRSIHGHCSVPHDNVPDPTLARWVKRQRYQYKLFIEGQRSAMTEERIQALEGIGFAWDTCTAAWERGMTELRTFQEMHGHVNVPATYQANKKLAAWVKCQRKQYKLLVDGKASTLTQDRVNALNQMGFRWKLKQ